MTLVTVTKKNAYPNVLMKLEIQEIDHGNSLGGRFSPNAALDVTRVIVYKREIPYRLNPRRLVILKQ